MNRPTHELNATHFTRQSSPAQELAARWLVAADTQGAGTILDGYPGGSSQAEAIQLGILADIDAQAGINAEVIDAASQLVLDAWEARRRNR